jgi:hypothetical protein
VRASASQLAFVCLFIVGLPAAGQTCDVVASLDACARDHGFNPGARCGFDAMSRAGLQGLPPPAPQAELGRSWDKSHMVDAARGAAKAGWVPVGVNTAICCGVGDPALHACLKAHRDEVSAWLLH